MIQDDDNRAKKRNIKLTAVKKTTGSILSSLVWDCGYYCYYYYDFQPNGSHPFSFTHPKYLLAMN